MQIVAIFASSLYAIHYEQEEENEYNRLIDLWTDMSYLRQFAKAKKIENIQEFIATIRKDAETIEDLMKAIELGEAKLESFFRPLDNMETAYKELSLQKGKLRKSYLRLYAIKIDENTFLLTGGAIKTEFKMSDSEDTELEKQKLKNAQDFLRSNGVFDGDSFYELMIEIEDKDGQ